VGTRPEAKRAVKAAREVAHAASYLASEAASLARVFESFAGTEESAAASKAAIRAARSAFDIDEAVLQGQEGPTVEATLLHARRALDAAADAVAAAREALEKAHARSGVDGAAGLGTS